jgi:hypothetical protein
MVDENEDGSADLFSTSRYYHSETPAIWNKKVIYANNVGSYSYDGGFNLMMYNISYSDTWIMPIGHNLKTRNQPLAFYGDYIMYSHFSTNWITYLYNWVENNYVGWKKVMQYDSTWVTYNYQLSETHAVFKGYTSTDPLPRHSYLIIYNLTSGTHIYFKCDTLGTALDVDSLYENQVGVTYYDGANYDAYVIDFTNLNWSAYTENIHNILTWENDIDDYRICVSNSTADESNVKVWDGWVCYNVHTPGYLNYNVKAYKMSSGAIKTITDGAYCVYLNDFKGDKAIFTNNINSNSTYGNAKDDFDVYRTETSIESIGNFIWDSAPAIVVLMIMGVIFGALALLGKSSG